MTDTLHKTAERRRHSRTHIHIRIRALRLDPDGGEVIDSLQMQDISRGGLGAISEKPYYPGQRVILCLPMSAAKGRRNVYATIRRCRRVEDGYSLGMEFDTVSMAGWASNGDNALAA